MMALISLLDEVASVVASSVLGDDEESFGVQRMFDGINDTCWNSDQGSPQTLTFKFKRPVDVTTVDITFQGGFVGQSMDVEAAMPDAPFRFAGHFEPEDENEEQRFSLLNKGIPDNGKGVSDLRVVFNKSTDFYGRVTIYALDIKGSVPAGS